ncbi:hypothetical protein WJX73_000612 [Symbiochloris irregularis]|uniref:J domain-containing protein n=1 Tax=Symbiochloris irregularis TaxID=706552 RepID=A0AAW1NVI4_9CHLO
MTSLGWCDHETKLLQGVWELHKHRPLWRRFFNVDVFILLVGWLVWVLILWQIRLSAEHSTSFDPYEVLQVSRSASKADIARAFRKLSQLYHPDKPSDPRAHKYFAEIVTAAYNMLTDPMARRHCSLSKRPNAPQ